MSLSIEEELDPLYNKALSLIKKKEESLQVFYKDILQ